MSMQESKRYTALLNKFSQNRILYISEGQLLVVKPKSDRFKFLKKKKQAQYGRTTCMACMGNNGDFSQSTKQEIYLANFLIRYNQEA